MKTFIRLRCVDCDDGGFRFSDSRRQFPFIPTSSSVCYQPRAPITHRGTNVECTALEHDGVLVVDAGALREDEQRDGVLLVDVLLHASCHNRAIVHLCSAGPKSSRGGRHLVLKGNEKAATLDLLPLIHATLNARLIRTCGHRKRATPDDVRNTL